MEDNQNLTDVLLSDAFVEETQLHCSNSERAKNKRKSSLADLFSAHSCDHQLPSPSQQESKTPRLTFPPPGLLTTVSAYVEDDEQNSSDNDTDNDRWDSITSACSALSLDYSTEPLLPLPMPSTPSHSYTHTHKHSKMSSSTPNTINTTPNTTPNTNTNNMNQWSHLPDDVFVKIMQYLPSYSIRILRSTCKSWYASVSRASSFVRPEKLDNTNPIHLSSTFPNIHTLDLSLANPQMIMCNTNGNGNGNKLRLQSTVTDNDLARFLSPLAHLRELLLHGCVCIHGSGFRHLSNIHSLQYVDCTGCTGLTDEGMIQGVEGLQHVIALTLIGCHGLTDASLRFIVAQLPRLERLAVPPQTTDAGLRALIDAPALQRVAIRGCSRVGASGIAMVLQAPRLKRVVVSRCGLINAETLSQVSPNLSVVSNPPPSGGGGGGRFGHRMMRTTTAPIATASSSLAADGATGTGVRMMMAMPSDLRLLMATFHAN